MGELTLRRARERLTNELVTWQVGAIGLLMLSVIVNLIMAGRIAAAERLQHEDAARYEQELQQAERVRDLAVRELGAMAMRQAEEQMAREAQAAAFVALEGYRYIGECTVTAYCPCEECCGQWADGITSTGLPAAPGIVAVDPEVIPLGSTVVIDGQRYLAADTGVRGKHVDIYLTDHAATVEAGVGTAEVWVNTEKVVSG